MKKRNFTGGLPDGQYTSDVDLYIRRWRRVGRSLAKILGGRLSSFDPQFTLVMGKRSWQLDIWQARKILLLGGDIQGAILLGKRQSEDLPTVIGGLPDDRDADEIYKDCRAVRKRKRL